MNKPILEISHIKKDYITINGTTKAIKDISMQAEKGSIITLVGPSGCGKSTLLSILAGIDEQTSGIIIKDENIVVGYMLQQDALFPWLTIYENAILGLKIKKIATKENKDYVKKLLQEYKLGDFLNAYPKELSGGMRQRVALIRTLALRPDILLLDEPFSALDYQSRLKISDDVYKIIKKENITAILVSHDISEAISMSDKVLVLSKRPCEIKNIYTINLTNKSTPIENRKAKEYTEYYDAIWKDIDFHV